MVKGAGEAPFPVVIGHTVTEIVTDIINDYSLFPFLIPQTTAGLLNVQGCALRRSEQQAAFAIVNGYPFTDNVAR